MTPETEELLRQTSFLQFLPQEHFERVRDLFHPVRYDFGDLIVREGEEADAFYILTSGRARIVRSDGQGHEIVLATLRPGNEFGESALLNKEKRSATVRCSTTVEAQRLAREHFLKLLEEFPRLQSYLETTARWRTLHSFLYEFSNFGRLPQPALNALLEKLETVVFEKGETIVQKGDPAGPMFIIRSGRVRVYHQEGGQQRNLSFLREGDFFGELSILNESPRGATVEAVQKCTLLALPLARVRELIEEFPEFEKVVKERLAHYNLKYEARVPLDFSSELLPAEASVHTGIEEDVDHASPHPEQQETDSLFEDEKGHFRKSRKRIRKIPFIRQIDQMDCGAAALGMVCRHFGRKVSLARIRQLCHTSYDGTSLKAICHAATELGLAARAIKVSPRNLPHMPLPAIVHWGGNHWVVLYAVEKNHVRIADPGKGMRRVSRTEFLKNWSGYTALFDYTVEFENAPEGQATLSWLKPFVKTHQRTLTLAVLLSMVSSVLLLLFPIFTQVVMDQVIVEQDVSLLKLILGGIIIAQAFTLCSNLLQQYLLSFATVKMDSAVLDFLTRYLLALPMSYFTSRRTGDIQRRLDGARQIRSFVVQQALGGILSLIYLLGSLGLMLSYNPFLTGIFLVSIPLYAGLMRFSSKVLRPLYTDLEEGQARYSSAQIDAIKGIEAVKAAAAENAFRDAMLNDFLSLARKRFRGSFVGMSYQSMLQVVGLMNTTLFLWFASNLVIEGKLTVGGFVAFNSLIAMASGAILRTLGLWDSFQMVMVLLNRLSDVFEQEPEQGRDRQGLMPVRTLEGHIKLRNVGFRYGGPEAPEILKNINFEIAPGRTVAIVGRSGCGKTTLIKLLAGLLEPTQGVVRFDHVDMRTLNYRDLRRQIGMVLQENHMFGDTIMHNIAFGDPEPDFKKVLRASHLANAHEFIMRLPLGYETVIGESGLALSGGQRQRISIARALYPDPPVLIFDEATSALDTESEKAIQGNLTSLMANRTTIIIAHRLSTIREADTILVLEKGSVVESGTHQQLIEQRGLYFYLSSQQLGI